MPGSKPNCVKGKSTGRHAKSSFTPRVIAVILIILVLFLGWTFFWLLYAERQALFEARRLGIVDQVQVAVSLCRHYNARVETGELTRSEAIELARQDLQHLRFGPQSAGHFYVLSTTGMLIAHPMRMDLVGTDVLAMRDGQRKPFVEEIVNKSQHQPLFTTSYRWRWQDSEWDVPELLACAGRFEPWNWIIVTDVTTADIDEQITGQLMRQVGILLFVVTVLAGVLSVTLRRLVLAGVDRLIDAARQLAAGDLSVRVIVSPTNELNALAVSFNRMAEGIQARDEQIRLTHRTAVFALAKLADVRDRETGRHLLRVREYATLLAHTLRKQPGWKDIIDKQFLDDIYDASMLHDIGKVGIPDDILHKPDVLDEGERAIMMSHTLIGANTIRAARLQMKAESSFLIMAEQIARSHHERWDGEGYVEALVGEGIPPAARIFSVADVYDALTTERPYKQAMGHNQAVELIAEDEGKRFDPQVFQAFLRIAEKFDEIRLELADN
jgi:response regulator RpfG family c-di-GMP phosphodiesterase